MDLIQTIYDYNNDLTVLKVKGKPGFEYIIKVLDEYYAGKVTKYLIWDLMEADASKITNDEMKNIAKLGRRFAESRKGGKTALVADKDFAFGLSRMFEAFAELEGMPTEIRSFRSIEEAKKWFGIPV